MINIHVIVYFIISTICVTRSLISQLYLIYIYIFLNNIVKRYLFYSFLKADYNRSRDISRRKSKIEGRFECTEISYLLTLFKITNFYYKKTARRVSILYWLWSVDNCFFNNKKKGNVKTDILNFISRIIIYKYTLLFYA